MVRYAAVSRNSRWVALLLATFVAVTSASVAFFASSVSGEPHGSFSNISTEPKAVTVLTRREGDLTHFYVDNQEYCEVTMTFEMGLDNLKGTTSFPYTATFPPREKTEAFALSPVDADERWEYSYTNYYKLGSNCAQHDDSYLYQLPYAAGSTFRVTQAYDGSFSHKGSNKYAVDWKMSEGTPVHAARGGIVVKTRDDSNRGGASMKFDKYNNYVLIRHDDGTLGHYCHLKKGGCKVQLGQIIQTGDLIALSGNTGFSSGPHLHFCVFKTLNGRERESIPVKFKTAEGKALVLSSGKDYRAAELPPHPAAPQLSATGASAAP